MDIINNVSKIIDNNFDHIKINNLKLLNDNIKTGKLRRKKNGLSIKSVLNYNLLMTDIGATLDKSTIQINHDYDCSFTRQAYDKKSKNIDIDVYENCLKEVVSFYNKTYNNIDVNQYIAVDGTYNNVDYEKSLNIIKYGVI